MRRLAACTQYERHSQRQSFPHVASRRLQRIPHSHEAELKQLRHTMCTDSETSTIELQTSIEFDALFDAGSLVSGFKPSLGPTHMLGSCFRYMAHSLHFPPCEPCSIARPNRAPTLACQTALPALLKPARHVKPAAQLQRESVCEPAQANGVFVAVY